MPLTPALGAVICWFGLDLRLLFNLSAFRCHRRLLKLTSIFQNLLIFPFHIRLEYGPNGSVSVCPPPGPLLPRRQTQGLVILDRPPGWLNSPDRTIPQEIPMTEVESTQQQIDHLPFLDSNGVLDDISQYVANRAGPTMRTRPWGRHQST
jgi:hypothetical protein